MSVLPMFSSMSFMVSGLTVKSLIHSELIFVYGVRKWPNSFTCICSVFPVPLIEETVFSPLYIIFFYLFIFVCIGFSLLCAGFL